jgi:hypothetical protein
MSLSAVTDNPLMEPPDPRLYHPDIHKAHVARVYTSVKKRPKPARIVRLPQGSELTAS